MLLFQVNAILLTVFALAKCGEHPKLKAGSGKRLTKRHLMDAFDSNPIFRRVFQSANPDDTLTNKFLGAGNQAEYTIDNGDYSFHIYMQPIDDEDYANQGAYVESEDNADDVLNYAPNYEDTIAIETAKPEDEDVKVDESEDQLNQVDHDGNTDLQFITSKPYIPTPKPNVTAQDTGDQKQNLRNDTVPIRENNTSLYTHVDVTHAKTKDSIPVTEYVSVIKSTENKPTTQSSVPVGDIVVNNIAANVVKDNTLYVSPVLQNYTANLTYPVAINATYNIPEIDQRFLIPLPPRTHAEIKNNAVRRPQVPKKEGKPASSQTGGNGATSFLDNLVTYYLINSFFGNNQKDSSQASLMPAWMSKASENIYNALANPSAESSPNTLLMSRNRLPPKRDASKNTPPPPQYKWQN